MADPTKGNKADAAQPPLEQIQLFYSNGFDINASLSDIGITFMYDGNPVMRLALSFTTAKTLSSQLQIGIAEFEAATKQSLLTMGDVSKGYEALHNEKSSN